MTEAKEIVIRRMKPEDLEAVYAIETGSFSTPWSRKSFEQELDKEYSYAFVALSEGRIVGYLIQWQIVDEIHIANVAVDAGWRRRGVGMKLLREGLAACPSCPWIGLEVRESNHAARSLYSKLGFQEVGVRRRYYDGKEDAILMARQRDTVSYR